MGSTSHNNGSNHLVIYILQQMRRLGNDQFITRDQAYARAHAGKAKNRVLVHVDDLIGTGEQARSTFQHSPKDRFAAAVYLSLLCYRHGARATRENVYGKGFEILAAEDDIIAVNEPEHPFARSVEPRDLERFREMTDTAHRAQAASLAFFYMSPDNCGALVRDFTKTLRIPVFQRQTPESATTPP